MPKDNKYSYTFTGIGLTPEELPLGKKMFNEYRNQFEHLQSASNSRLLEELVWKELVQDRFKKQVGEACKLKNKDTGEPIAIPSHLQQSMNDGLEQILKLKEKLGMFAKQEETDSFKNWKLLEIKAAQYRKEHPLSFKTTCPHCAGIFYLKRRTEGFEEFISPFYAEDKVLNNRPLWKLYKDGKITQDDVAAVLGVSPDYIPWLDEHVYGNKQKAIEEHKEQPPSEPPTLA
jgi:hypothetical protein